MSRRLEIIAYTFNGEDEKLIIETLDPLARQTPIDDQPSHRRQDDPLFDPEDDKIATIEYLPTSSPDDEPQIRYRLSDFGIESPHGIDHTAAFTDGPLPEGAAIAAIGDDGTLYDLTKFTAQLRRATQAGAEIDSIHLHLASPST